MNIDVKIFNKISANLFQRYMNEIKTDLGILPECWYGLKLEKKFKIIHLINSLKGMHHKNPFNRFRKNVH